MKCDKFSVGVEGDEDGIRMSSLECVARHLANRLSDCASAVDLCCAIGITAIQLAKRIPRVFAVDTNEARVAHAANNARVYGVRDKIEFVVGSALDISVLRRVAADVAVIDPEWRRESLRQRFSLPLVRRTVPDLMAAFWLAKEYVAPRVVLRLPEEFTVADLRCLGPCRIERIIWNGVVDCQLCYFDGTTSDWTVSELAVS